MASTGSEAEPGDPAIESQSSRLALEGPPFGLEFVYDYEPGGHHPVHLGDLLDYRYKAIHKLGSGGYATVWLCLDISSPDAQYVAIKIIAAEGSI